MTQCWFCSTEMIWQSDFSFEDYGFDGEGMVAVLSCPKCGCTAEFSLSDEEESFDNQ